MTNITLPQIRLSPSSQTAFKKCPRQFQLGNLLGLRQEQEADVLRVGSSWHACHEVYDQAIIDGKTEEEGIELVHLHINDRYKEVPAYANAEEWGDEAFTLFVWFQMYRWYYGEEDEDAIVPLATEVPFEFSLHNPIGLPLLIKEVIRLGKIDKVAAYPKTKQVGNVEYKTTSRNIGYNDEYWEQLRFNTQISAYALAAEDMERVGLDKYGITIPEGYSWGATIFDVFKKPTTKRKFLTQAETTELAETGEYCGVKFEVDATRSHAYISTAIDNTETTVLIPDPKDTPPFPGRKKADWPKIFITGTMKINGEKAEVKPGTKAYAVYETRLMFGVRLQQEMKKNAEKHFQRRVVVRSEQERAQARLDQYNIYQAMKSMATNGGWYPNENNCRNMGNCTYLGICHGTGYEAAVNGGVPIGYTKTTRETLEGEYV